MPPREFQFEIDGADGEPIRGDLRLPRDGPPGPLLLICHGFKGFKDWGFFPHLSRSLADRGVPNAIFNFSHCGVAEDGEAFSRLDLFEKGTWGKELFDLQAVMAAASSGKLPEAEAYDGESFLLLGHSRGGGVVILTAAREPKVRRVATMASISHVDRFSDEVKQKWKREGVISIWNMRTKQEMPMDVAFLEDLEENREVYSVEKAAGSLEVPLLVLHGGADSSVPVEEAHDIASWAPGDLVKKVIIPECDHVLGSGHPFPGTNPTLEEGIRILAGFFL